MYTVGAHNKIEVQVEDKKYRGPYRQDNDASKQRFWKLVVKRGYSAYKAAKMEHIPLQKAYTWKRNWNKFVVNLLNGITMQPKKRGRNPILTEEHKVFL